MKKSILLKLTVLAAASVLMFTACTTPGGETASTPVTNQTVEITDIHGTVTVPVNPQVVVALDNRTFETLADWDIELAAVPKAVMPSDSPYVADESVLDIGSHNDPNLELIASVNPDLVIIGQRFAQYEDEIRALVPNAVVINLNFNVSAEAATPGANLVDGFTNSTLALGQIFDKNEEAAQLVADFEASIARLNAAYDENETVMTVIVSGGEVRFAAPGSGRVWGPLYEIFGWTSSLEIEDGSSDHQGDDISIEAIAQSNPDWIFVLDRDAATSSADGGVPAIDVIANSPALQNITAVTTGQMVFAPNNTYTNESIQTFTRLFEDIAGAMEE